MRIAGMVLGRAALAGVGVALMWREGQYQSQPGIWFAVGMVLLGVALIPWRSK